MAPDRAYLVCSTPRSGSTLLCELLKDTGAAGAPEEYFEATAQTGAPPHPGDYLDGLPRTGAGIRDDLAPPEAPPYSSLAGVGDYRAHLERTWRLGTTPNGVFASKLMWHQIDEMRTLLATLPEYGELVGTSPYEFLCRVFGDPAFVLISRRDKVRQAVSMWRALQTRSWRHGGNPRTGPLHYSFEGVDHLVRALTRQDEAWRTFFTAHGIDALQISYEDDLERDRRATVSAVLEHIGVDLPEQWQPADPIGRQADELSEEWVRAYHRERAAQSRTAERAAP
jgi:LPS sulfotransferase NodH